MVLPDNFDAKVGQAVEAKRIAAEMAKKQFAKARTATGNPEAGEDTCTLVRAGSKSGYAKDKFPSQLDGEERAGGACPIADKNGKQEGRLSPTMRQGGTGYEAVTAAEADRRRVARMRGTLPKIPGGIDDPIPKKGVALPHPKITGDESFEDKRMDMGVTNEAPANVTPATRLQHQALQQAQSLQPAQVPKEATHKCTCTVERSKADDYLAKRSRVQFIVDGGTYSVPTIDMKVTAVCLTILLPCGSNDATFIPKPGSRLTVCAGERQWPCFFPGTACELPELGVMALILIVDHETGSTDKGNG